MTDMQPQENPKRRNLSPIIGVVVVIVAVAGYLLIRNQQTSTSTDNTTQTPSNTDTNTQNPAGQDRSLITPTPTAPDQAAVKAFTVQGSNFAFAPSTLTVNKGDKVKITFQNSGGSHNFVIDELNVKTAILPSGQSATVEFTADKTGTFEYYCSVGSHRAMGMKGSLIVE
jgi:nitrosocyanin